MQLDCYSCVLKNPAKTFLIFSQSPALGPQGPLRSASTCLVSPASLSLFTGFRLFHQLRGMSQGFIQGLCLEDCSFCRSPLGGRL